MENVFVDLMDIGNCNFIGTLRLIVILKEAGGFIDFFDKD